MGKHIDIRLTVTFICILVCWKAHVLKAQVNDLQMKKRTEFGFQISPFALVAASPLQGLLLDTVLLQMTNVANANPSLQAGFFVNYRHSKKWGLRVEANLMHRSIFYSISYPFRGVFSDMFTKAAIAPTVNTSWALHYRLTNRLSVGAGLAGQFHFTINGDIVPDPTNPVFAPVLNQVDRAVKPVTWHSQLSFVWYLKRWNLGFSWQRSLNSMTTSIAYNGQKYPLPILHTEFFYLNIGDVLLPARKT